MKKILTLMILLSAVLIADEIKESPKARAARVTYEKSVKKAELIILRAKVKYAKDLKIAIKTAAVKGDMKEANRVQDIIDKLDISSSKAIKNKATAPHLGKWLATSNFEADIVYELKKDGVVYLAANPTFKSSYIYKNKVLVLTHNNGTQFTFENKTKGVMLGKVTECPAKRSLVNKKITLTKIK